MARTNTFFTSVAPNVGRTKVFRKNSEQKRNMATRRFDLLTFSEGENSQNSSDSDNDNSEIVTVDAEVSLRRDKGAASGELSDRNTDGFKVALYDYYRKHGEITQMGSDNIGIKL